MTANIYKKCVYSFMQEMWHNITKPSLVPMGAVGVMEENFEGGFPIILREYTYELNGQRVTDGDCVIIRGASKFDPMEYKLGTCTERFNPLQPIDICRSFDENVRQIVETIGFLGHGGEMFISWKLPSFEVKAGDELQLYGMGRFGFDTMVAASLLSTIYRPVCANTVAMAQGWADKNTDGMGRGNIWKGKGTNPNLLRDLGYWFSFVQKNAEVETELLKSFFSKIANTPVVSDYEVKGILDEAYPNKGELSSYIPSELRTSKEEKLADYNDTQAEIRDSIYGLFSGVGTGITSDYYGLFNATTEYFNHYQPSKRPIAESAMFGPRQNQMMRMAKVLLDRVS